MDKLKLENIKKYITLHSDSITEKELKEYIKKSNLSDIEMIELMDELKNNDEPIYDEYPQYDVNSLYPIGPKSHSTALKQYLLDISKYDLLEPEEQNELIIKANKGNEEAKKALINHNLRLVVSVAKKYQNFTTMTLLDIIQEGNIGLIQAANKYQLGKGAKFSTYAVFWIKQAITRSISDKEKAIRTPIHAVEKLSKIYKERINYYNENGEQLTEKNINEEILEELNMTKEQYEFLNNIPLVTKSLEEYVFSDENGDGSTIGDLIPDDYCLEEEVLNEMQRLEIRTILDEMEKNAKNKYKKREIEIVRRRFGIRKDGTDGEAETLSSIKKDYNITTERVRQIEAKGLSRIRKNNKIKKYNIKNNNT